MTTYTAVTNLPSTPASLSEADTHLSLTTPGINAQHYEWQGNSAGFWNPVNDDNGGVATATFLTQRTQKFSYDFSVDGGAVGNVTLRGGTIPSGALVVGQACVVTTTLADGGAGTAHIKTTLQSDGDIQSDTAATNISQGFAAIPATITFDFSTASLLLVAATSIGIQLTQARSLVFAISTHALTAGKFDIYITYMVPA